ncbi:RDD family protein [Streptacidiphilus sp. PAMC 29251]
MAVVGGAVAAAGAPVIARGVTHLQDRIDAARLLPGQTKVWLLDQQTLADLGLLLLGLLVAGLLYEAVPTALWGRTLGKALFGLRVLDRRSKSKPGFGGSLARWLSYQLMLVLLVGVFDLLWCMVDRPWRQCWHDKIGRTFVTPSRPAAAPGE